MSTFWVILDKTSKDLIAQVITNGGHPKDFGWNWKPESQEAWVTNRQGNPGVDVFNYTTKTWESNLASLETRLLLKIDLESEEARMRVLTQGGAKKYIYMKKDAEYRDYTGLLISVVNALSLIDKRKRFPFAMAEVDLSGDSLATVMTRFEIGINNSIGELARVEALAQRTKRAIRTATTVSGKKAAAQVIWS